MLDQGWSLNLDRAGPVWCWFDAERYGRSDALAARAARIGPAAALDDFQDRGAALGYAPNIYFDPAFYLQANPGVALSIAAGDFPSAFDHYRLVGWRDRDPHWLFSHARYHSNYSDLTPAAVDEQGGLYGHYLDRGAHEARSASPFFDVLWYLERLSPEERDRAAANPFGHFITALDQTGASPLLPEPQGSPYFDPTWYTAAYQDVAKLIVAGRFQGALHHYLTAGAAEGLDPLCDFSETDYRQANPDVTSAIREEHFPSGFDHFLNFGAFGGRSPNRDVDLPWYAAQPRVVRDLATGRFAHPFAHLLAVGIPQGLPSRPPISPNFALNEAETRAGFLVQAQRALPAFGRRPLDFTHAGTPDVSVIVVLRNQFALTMQALGSLRHTFDGAIDLIIVDNASSDETVNIADLVLGARIIRNTENVGFLRACNAALVHAAANAVLYLNNDVILHADAVRFAVARLATDPSIGAVGGKILRTHGMLQEAGCMVWRDGSAEGWQRDAPADAPEANYVREVDFCSGAFLMVRGDLLRRLGGFDDAYAPAYYEEVDLCLRIQAAGFRVLYDPAIVLTHYEYASSRSARAASALMLANRATLRARHTTALRNRVVDRRRRAEAAGLASSGRRILFIEDTVPLSRLGSGYGRAADVVVALVEAGWQVTVFPMHPVTTPRYQITAAMPDTAEILWDRDHRTLEAFLDDRRGYYDVVWVSRAHNLRQLSDVMNRSGIGLEGAKLVLDTEAVFSLRDAARASLDGLPFGLASSLAREFEGGWLCDHVVAVNAAERDVLRELPLSSVGIVGFHVVPRPTPAPWEERRGLLHIGALTSVDSPNSEGLRWFLEMVHPELVALVGAEDARLTIIGHTAETVDLSWLRDHPAVDFRGAVSDVEPLYGAHRVFIAPTRFAAGMPTKVLDAASRGIPIVCTDLLATQLDWEDSPCVLSSPVTDSMSFAANIARLLTDREAWNRQRDAALEAITVKFNPALFADQIAAALASAGAAAPAPAHAPTDAERQG